MNFSLFQEFPFNVFALPATIREGIDQQSPVPAKPKYCSIGKFHFLHLKEEKRSFYDLQKPLTPNCIDRQVKRSSILWKEVISVGKSIYDVTGTDRSQLTSCKFLSFIQPVALEIPVWSNMNPAQALRNINDPKKFLFLFLVLTLSSA